MVNVDKPGEVEDAVNEFYQMLSEPSTRASRFYTLYYLSEIKGKTKYGFDLMQEAEMQRDSFYNYSIYACLSELRHLIDQIRVGSIRLGEITDIVGETSIGMRGDFDEDEVKAANEIVGNIRGEIEGNAPDEAKDIVELLMLTDPPKNAIAYDKEDVVKVSKKAEEKYSAYTEGRRFLKACKFVFGHNWTAMYNRKDPGYIQGQHRNGNIGWVGAYGGEAWSRVAKTAMLKHDMGDKTFTDLMWSVEHNNGNFVDKVPLITSDELEVVAKYMRQEIEETAMRGVDGIQPPNKKVVGQEITGAILKAILSFGRSENIRPLYKITDSMWPGLFDRDVNEDMFPMEGYMVKREQIRNMLR